MYIALAIILFIILLTFIVLSHPKFGKLPKGERLERIKKSPNYKNESFQNQSITPDLTEGENMISVAFTFFFKKSKRVTPKDKIPNVKTNLLNLDITKDVLVWFGHSSYFIQIDKKRILVDPVFCGYASPFSFTAKAFDGSDIYKVEDIPEIDYLFISHDHWDHLDFETVKKLKPKIKKVICSLGTAEHLEHWGYNKQIIIEKDWNERIDLGDNFIVHTTPARHFSGRGFKRNQALWMSYVLQTPTLKLFIGGDSGYDKHFTDIGKQHGPFDLAILENGQYDKSWRYIHMLPDEILKAVKDLNAKRLLAVHNSKFAIANHDWDEPMIKITTNCKAAEMPLLTPKIGEIVYLKNEAQVFEEWWMGIN
jgi:L-ascorbate metabolism protein UlaG (beta-lactamase superfamily)